MVPDGLLKDGQGSLADLVLLKSTQLSFVKLRLGNVHVLAVFCVKEIPGLNASDAPHGRAP